LDVEIEEYEIDPVEVLDLADRLGLSGYDASYLWLARALGAELITLDDRLAKAAAKP
jgi:predicted nucleic acid-binding protein